MSAVGRTLRGVQPDWMERGACRDTDTPELWYPPPGGSTLPARQVCTACPVQQQCLNFALSHQEVHGVWGGVSERKRATLAKQRHARVDASTV